MSRRLRHRFFACLTVIGLAATTAAAPGPGRPENDLTVDPEADTKDRQRWLIPTVAHSTGLGDSRWRSDVAVVHRGDVETDVVVTFLAPAGPMERTVTIASGAAVEWRDILVSLFGLADGASLAGALHIASAAPLAVTSRTYNQSATGTYGQFLPALRAGDALGPGAAALLPQLRNTDEFYTNIGILNLGDGAATATVTLHAGDGATVGTAFDISAPAGSWKQANDVFRSSGAGDHEIAYATVELSSGDAAWAYASVVDRSTRDPTTIPMTVGTPAAAGLKTRSEGRSRSAGTARAAAGREPLRPQVAPATAAAHPTAVRPAVEARIAATGDTPAGRFGSVDPAPRGGRLRAPPTPSKLTGLEAPALDLSPAYGTHPERRAVDAAAAGRPRIALADGLDVPPRVLRSDIDRIAAAGGALGDPAVAAIGDLDGDGASDVVIGHRDGGRTVLSVHRGNVDALVPWSDQARRRRLSGTFDGSPFPHPARLAELPIAAGFLAIADLDGDARADVLAAEIGGRDVILLTGSGGGGFGPPRRIPVTGAITAVAVGEIGRRDGLQDLAVAVVDDDGPAVLVFQHPSGAVDGDPERIPLADEGNGLAIGRLVGGPERDLAVATASGVTVLAGRDRWLAMSPELRPAAAPPARLEIPFDTGAVDLVSGDFGPGRGDRLAVLDGAGGLWLVDPAAGAAAPTPLVPATSLAPVSKRSSADLRPSLVRARLSTLPTDVVVVLDPGRRAAQLITPPSLATAATPPAAEIAFADDPVAVLAARLNRDALDDLVVVKRGGSPLATVETTVLASWTVNTSEHGVDYRIDGVCDADNDTPGDQCTLFAAIQEANESPGQDAIGFSVSQVIGGSFGPVDTVVIDGGGVAAVEIIDATMTLNHRPADGLSSANSTIAGLAMPYLRTWKGAGSRIEGCYIGLQADGATPSTPDHNAVGLIIEPEDITVGGGAVGSSNVIWGELTVNPEASGTIEGNVIGLDESGSFVVAPDDPWGGIDVRGASGVTIVDNVITNPGRGIQVRDWAQEPPSDILIQGNFIGTDLLGLVNLRTPGTGVDLFDGDQLTVGGSTPALGNVIAGKGASGISAHDDVSNLVVQGNFVGTDVTGLEQMANGWDIPTTEAIHLQTTSTALIGGAVGAAGNVIAGGGSGNDGLSISSSSSGDTGQIVVQGNYVGTDGLGETAFPHGIGIRAWHAPDVVIGGAGAAAGNVVSGNLETGISLVGNDVARTVQGNAVGTNAAGSAALPNGESGIRVGTAGARIGGAGPGEGNVVAGNLDEGLLVQIFGEGGVAIAGNRIGVGRDGSTAIPNGGPGVDVAAAPSSGPSGIVVGGASDADRNVIAHNGEAGVVVRSGRGTTVRGNSIFANGGLAVDLSPNGADQPPDGVTPNDDLDADGGPNELQNAPVLAAFVGDAVQGTLHSAPDTTFTVDVYQSTDCGDATRHAETPVATASVTTDAAGDAQLSIPLGPGAGYLTATATAPDGSTSEPSPCLDYVLSGDRELRIVAPAEITAGGDTPVEVRVVIGGSVADPSFDGQATVRLDPSGTPDLAELVSGNRSGTSLTVTMADGELAEPLYLRTPPGWSPMMAVEADTVLDGTVELRAEADGDLEVAAAIDVETPLDLAIDRIEVQQGPRTVPLDDMIRNRWIMVRVFVEDRGELFDRFAGLVDLTGTLHVADQTGSPVPGSPFELKDSRWVGNSNRNRPFVLRPDYDSRRRWRGENAFNVILDPLPSRRLELRAELDEVFPDRDRGNEEGELGPMRFRDTRPATVLYQLARGTNGGTTTGLPEMAHIQASMRFMDLAYPVSSRSIRWVRLRDREYDGIPLWTGENELPLWLSLPDVVNPVGLVTFVDDQYLPLFGRGDVLGLTNRLGGTIAVVNSDDCGPPRNDCSTLAHEIGHMYRLGDTYAGGGENPAVNPLRPDATASGNWVEDGTFNWFYGWYAERYDRHLSFDFMGNGIRAWTDVATWNALAPRFRTPTAKTLRAGDTVLVRGTAFNGGGGELLTAYTLDGLAPSDEPGGSLTIALAGQGGGTLASTTYEPSFDVTDSDIPAPEDRFGVVLPWDDRARRIELRSGGTVLDERPISASDPVASFTASPTGSLDGDVAVSWQGSDPDGDALVYSLFFSPDGALHVPIVSETTSTSVTWDGFEAFAGDAPRLVLVASDGVRSVRVESATFDVPDRPPEVAISEPADGGVYALGADVPLSASVLDREDGLPFAPGFRWSSDRDGGLGGGNDRVIATLSAGTHVISATYSDSAGNDASASVEITVADGPVCTLTCEPTVPETGIVGETITFAAGVATDSCADPVDVRWFLPDGSAAAGNPVDRTFTEPGSYPWAVVATSGAALCEAGGLLEIGVGGDVDPAWIVPTVAHAIGFGDSRWRSDVAVVNLSAGRVVVQLTFVRNDAPVSRSFVLQPGATVQYRDVLVSLFGFADSASVSGSLHVATDGPVTVASRTYNQSDDGTYGQFLPAVEIDGPLAPGDAATLPQLRSDAGFYTNVGFVNTSEESATVQVVLRDAGGTAIGDPLYASLEAGRWRQLNDVFDGLGDVPIAYADVEVVAGGGTVWAYASVVDRLTRDPTTIPMVR